MRRGQGLSEVHKRVNVTCKEKHKGNTKRVTNFSGRFYFAQTQMKKVQLRCRVQTLILQ